MAIRCSTVTCKVLLNWPHSKCCQFRILRNLRLTLEEYSQSIVLDILTTIQPLPLPHFSTINWFVSGRSWSFLVVYFSDPTLNEHRSWSVFWVRLGTKSFLFGYPRNEKRQKSFPLSLDEGYKTARSSWSCIEKTIYFIS